MTWLKMYIHRRKTLEQNVIFPVLFYYI